MNECKERKQKTDLEGLLYFIRLTVPYSLCFSHTLTIEIEKIQICMCTSVCVPHPDTTYLVEL